MCIVAHGCFAECAGEEHRDDGGRDRGGARRGGDARLDRRSPSGRDDALAMSPFFSFRFVYVIIYEG